MTTFSRTNIEVIAQIAGAAARRAAATAPAPIFRPATVAEFDDSTNSAQVRVDGDTGTIVAQGVSVISGSVTAGDRVMVVFVPPHGAFFFPFAANPFPALQTYTVGTTWTGAGTPVGRFTRFGDMVFGSVHWTLTGAPAGGTLLIDLPLRCRYSTHSVGPWASFGITNFVSASTRSAGARTSFAIVSDAGGTLSSATAGVGSGDVIGIELSYETDV